MLSEGAGTRLPAPTGALVIPNGQAAPDTEYVTLTPERAATWLTQYRYERQRPIVAGGLRTLTHEMEAGAWDDSMIQLGYIDGDSRPRLIDGQHRLMAQVEVGRPTRYLLWRRHFADSEALAAAYAKIDTGKVRGDHVAYRAFQLVDELHMTDDYVRRVGAATRLIHHRWISSTEMSRRPLTRLEKVELIREWGTVANDALTLMAGIPRGWRAALMAAAPFSIMLTTLKSSKHDLAVAFWERVAKREGLFAGDPAYALVSYLEQRRGGGTAAQEIARGCAAAWNAEYESRQLRIIRPGDRNAPLRLLGTEYK